MKGNVGALALECAPFRWDRTLQFQAPSGRFRPARSLEEARGVGRRAVREAEYGMRGLGFFSPGLVTHLLVYVLRLVEEHSSGSDGGA